MPITISPFRLGSLALSFCGDLWVLILTLRSVLEKKPEGVPVLQYLAVRSTAAGAPADFVRTCGTR